MKMSTVVVLICSKISEIYLQLIYSGDLKSGYLWILNSKSESVCKWSGFQIDLKSGSSTIWKLAQTTAILYLPFEIQTIFSGFQMVQFSNGWASAKAIAIVPTIWKWDHLKSDLQKSGFWMFLDFKWLDFRSPL